MIYAHCRNTDYFDVLSAPGIAALQDQLCDIFSIIAVPAFFFLSGYLFFRNYQPDQMLRKWKSRLFSLVIPFLLWNLLYYFAEMLLRTLPLTKGAFAGTTVPFTFSEFLQAAFNYKYLPVFWFMQYLIVYTVLAPALWFLLRKRTAGLIAVILVFSAVLGLSFVRLPGWTAFPYYLLHYIVAYLAGGFASLHFREIFEYGKLPVRKAFLFGIPGAGLVLWYLIKPSLFAVQFLRLLIGICIWFSLGAVRFPKPMRWMRYTFYLYAAHLMIAKITNLTICIKVSNSMITGSAVFLLLPLLAIAFCLGTAVLFRRFMPRTAFILGIDQTKKTGQREKRRQPR